MGNPIRALKRYWFRVFITIISLFVHHPFDYLHLVVSFGNALKVVLNAPLQFRVSSSAQSVSKSTNPKCSSGIVNHRSSKGYRINNFLLMEEVRSSFSSHDQHNGKADDDDWLEDGPDSTELDREFKARERGFHTMGYRDGVIAGKEASAQEGFNSGYKKAVTGGLKWGFLRGFTSALAALPDAQRNKLVEGMVKNKDQFWELCKNIRLISTDDTSKKLLDRPILQESNKTAEEKRSDLIERYYEELKSLVSELAVDIKFPVDD
ncbi:uncharacterized protein LOC144708374 [Wolffia australiana]